MNCCCCCCATSWKFCICRSSICCWFNALSGLSLFVLVLALIFLCQTPVLLEEKLAYLSWFFLTFFSFNWFSPSISLRFLVSPCRSTAVFLISKAVCLSFSIDFLSATSCSDFNSLSSYLSIRSSSRVSYSVSYCPPRPVPWTYFLIMVVKRSLIARRVTE